MDDVRALHSWHKLVLDNLVFGFPFKILVIGRVIVIQIIQIICKIFNGIKAGCVDERTPPITMGTNPCSSEFLQEVSVM